MSFAMCKLLSLLTSQYLLLKHIFKILHENYHESGGIATMVACTNLTGS
jgi:hypothetical protein